jgi:16S rRNA (uracil1498-N3)-methyltransferase
MGSGNIPPLRALPRVFVPDADPQEPIDLPKEEIEKFRKVLRLEEGHQIAVLPNDGSLIRCEFRARQAIPIEQVWPDTEAKLQLKVAQALPKGDRLETVIRMCTEIGVASFLLFESERSVVKWDDKKLADRLRRLGSIAQEAAEQSFRTRIPKIEYVRSLKEVLARHPEAVPLSEVEGLHRPLTQTGDAMTILVGPEGGWAPRELALMGDRGVTLGPRVLRTDTAAPAAAAMLLLNRG